MKIYIDSLKDADLNEEEIYDSLALLSPYTDTFWKSLVRHIFHYIYNPSWFPETFVNIPQIPSETFQNFSINHHNVEIKNYNAEIQPFTCTNNPENTNTSLERSSIENMDTLINPQHADTRMNETTETEFNSTFLDDGTLFSSHTVNTLIDLEGND